MISLPVPVSPKSSTGAALRATISGPGHDRGEPGVAADQALVAGVADAGDQVLWQAAAAVAPRVLPSETSSR